MITLTIEEHILPFARKQAEVKPDETPNTIGLFGILEKIDPKYGVFFWHSETLKWILSIKITWSKIVKALEEHIKNKTNKK